MNLARFWLWVLRGSGFSFGTVLTLVLAHFWTSFLSCFDFGFGEVQGFVFLVVLTVNLARFWLWFLRDSGFGFGTVLAVFLARS